ncbi:MAG: ABC transporter permease [Alphaproteobacteria bacterium RIFCSPHIGHO2_01_FULL_41_14]|nr:MAG: ABC transporter permease [Alphaproteobacteria bacterium GWB1_45_5]OFW75861.1 MAG: ABC transporter permease [Alphaproteobacteria bacterium GWA1_45_9]OFW89950.1 MAG: ABC transporter permease [Alphaproteobacteria bacterium RIFCSPHIGHO2_01_FULL_41_14]HCI48390.1 ABC transporter permease [Holosporales bacterium]
MTPSIFSEKYQKFISKKRSVYALYFFLGTFLISLGAELIANDKPLFVWYKHKAYFPLVVNYSEQEFGGTFVTAANYRDPFVKKLIKEDGWMIWPLIPYSYNTVNYDLTAPVPSPPSQENWLGTDDQGRDLLARLIYGYRFSIIFGLTVTLISVTIGFFMGAIQGYFGGYVDLTLQRFTEVWSGLPLIFLLITVSALFRLNFAVLVFVISAFKWMLVVPIVRAEFLKARHLDYVKAARIMGVKPFPIIFRHILPNVLSAPLTLVPFLLIASITLLATIDFLGFVPTFGPPSLGEILNQGKNNLYAPWIGITGFVALTILLTSLIFVGEGIRDAFRLYQSQGETIL